MTLHSRTKLAALLLSALALSACGGGGGGSTTPGPTSIPNRAPTANAGSDQSIDEQTSATLDGLGSSDPDADSLTYNWTQTSGTYVAIANANMAQATFDTPNVSIGSTITLTFQLRVSDTARATGTDLVDVVVNGVSNSDPVVDAGSDQSVGELTTVNLSGTASDADLGDTLTYSWIQIAGPAVSIADSDMATAVFDAPDVGPAGESLTFELAVNDSMATSTDTVNIDVANALAAVRVSGKVYYEFVPPNAHCRGLNFAATQMRPIRAATVQLLDAGTGNELESTVSTDDGDYSFDNVGANLDVRLRIRAELIRTDLPRWDVEVRDNTSQINLELAKRPLYVVDGGTFNTGVTNVTRDLTATTGWDVVSNSYTGNRAAAPFAILDAIYAGMRLVLTADANAIFDPMDAFWSVNNTRTAGPTNIDIGELSGSFYSGGIDSLFLLGDAGVDTGEFDDHVVVHEWGHYFEDVFSRSDSIGGPHGIGQSIDARLAFGEGWATALAAIALDEPQYCDTGAAGTSGGFGINTEFNTSGARGWYNEMSVATFLYDLWDADVDGSDNNSIGFGPIFATMTGPQFETEAFTTIFSFATELRKILNAAQLDFVDSQLDRENIESTGIDIWATNQGSINVSPNNAGDVLPLYTTLPIDGTTINLCVNSNYDSRREGNKLAEYRFFKMDVAQQQSYNIVVETISADGGDPSEPAQGFDCVDAYENNPDAPLVHTYSDPDFVVFSKGARIVSGLSCTPNKEEGPTPLLTPGTYLIELTDYRFADEDTVTDYPGSVCFSVTVNPI